MLPSLKAFTDSRVRDRTAEKLKRKTEGEREREGGREAERAFPCFSLERTV